MKNKVLQRLLAVFSALEAHPGGLSAEELGKMTGYPADLVLNDLNDILYYTEMAGFFTVYPDVEADLPGEGPEDGYEPLDAPVSYRVKDPRAKWNLLATAGPFPSLNLTLEEAVALLWLFDEYPPPGELQPFCGQLVGSLLPGEELDQALEMAQKLHTRGGVTLAESKYLDPLRKAVLEERKIRINYYAKNWDKEVSWLLHPLGLIFHAGSGAWYLVAMHGKNKETVVCHLDRINGLALCEEKFDYPEDFSLRHYLKQRWGMDMSPPAAVRVRFYNEANVIKKVKREFKARRLPAPRELPGGSLEYQGEILGVHNFAKWVLSFGSSAEVLEPAWLREEMIRIARLWCQVYSSEE